METTSPHFKPVCLILDVDGVMTTGQFLYTTQGKAIKIFGPDDNDGLSLLKPHLEIRFITGDKKGFPVSKKRIVDDMGFSLDLVSTIHQIKKKTHIINNSFFTNREAFFIACDKSYFKMRFEQR